MKIVAFFNNKGGVGKTSLVYHLAWMYADLGLQVLAVDFDPQANLTSMFLDEDRLEELSPDGALPQTVLGAIQPLLLGTGDIETPYVEEISDSIGLLAGDLGLSTFEDELSAQWPACLDRKPRAFRVISALFRLIAGAARQRPADAALIDVGPNLGAINRAALIASEFVIVPLAPDLFSLQGLRNLGPALQNWRRDWKDRLERNPDPTLELPGGEMRPGGYVVLQHSVRADRPVKAYGRWMDRIPSEYSQAVLRASRPCERAIERDPNCLALLKHYRSLMPMAMEARKPMFHLQVADGAIGAHFNAVRDCRADFERLARRVASACGIALPP